MGLVLLERLRKVPGVKFEIVASPAAAEAAAASGGPGKAAAASTQASA
jgi:hypothetical protein